MPQRTKIGAWDYVWRDNLAALNAQLFDHSNQRTEDAQEFCDTLDKLIHHSDKLSVEQIYTIGRALELAVRLGSEGR